jgi:NAD(P)-dependent dehydrogenase (short-subunit alcohol dehydrogenase family)
LNTVSWYSASLELREHGDTTVPFTILSVESLAGKVVLVTGGARKLGRAMVSAAAHAGAKVALTYLGSKSSSEKLIEELAQANREGLAVECDVRDPRSVAAAVTKVIRQFGAIDVLINNAAVFETRAFDRITAEEWDRVFATNVRGPFLVSQECLPVLRKSRGRIINLGSLGGEKPWATHAHYNASKAALHMLTKTMAKALAPEIAVNCVAPGMIDANESERDEDVLARLAQRTPMKRNGTPDDVVSAVMYFATAPHFVTGQILIVDGGLGLV